MEKRRPYRNGRLGGRHLRALIQAFGRTLPESVEQPTVLARDARLGYDDWSYDTDDQLFMVADEATSFYYHATAQYRSEDSGDRRKYHLAVTQDRADRFVISVEAPTVEEIESVFAALDEHRDEIRRPPPPEPIARPRIFIGHGSDDQWRDLRDHLADQQGFDVQSFESGSRAGHTIRDILDDLLKTSTIAVLVLTGEDTMGDGAIRARQNVIHEAGLFQGKLGWDRAILLVEEGIEGFSNEQGILQIRFDQGQIRQTFGDVVATIRREFPGET